MRSSEKKTVLILGISSFVGINLTNYLKKEYRVVGTYNFNPVQIHGVFTIKLDVFNKNALDRLVFSVKPDVVIYCAGVSSVNGCHEDQDKAEMLNTSGVVNVLSVTEKFGVKFIYFSSPFIFSGEEGGYTEGDTPAPVCVYGANQSSAEFYIQKNSLNYLIFRTCRLFGRGYHLTRINYLEFLENKFTYRESFSCDNKLKTGFFNVLLLAKIISMSIQKDTANRLFQVSSEDTITQYDFAKIYAKIHGHDDSLASAGQLKFPLVDKKHFVAGFSSNLDFSMNTENIESYFNIKLPSVESMLLNFFIIHGLSNRSKISKEQRSDIKYI